MQQEPKLFMLIDFISECSHMPLRRLRETRSTLLVMTGPLLKLTTTLCQCHLSISPSVSSEIPSTGSSASRLPSLLKLEGKLQAREGISGQTTVYQLWGLGSYNIDLYITRFGSCMGLHQL